MTYTTGQWTEEWLSEDRTTDPARIVAVNHGESTVTTRSATVEVSLPYGYRVGGTDTIDVRWNPNDPRPDGNRAQRRAYRFGRRTV
jgi:hypothetical protein